MNDSLYKRKKIFVTDKKRIIDLNKIQPFLEQKKINLIEYEGELEGLFKKDSLKEDLSLIILEEDYILSKDQEYWQHLIDKDGYHFLIISLFSSEKSLTDFQKNQTSNALFYHLLSPPIQANKIELAIKGGFDYLELKLEKHSLEQKLQQRSKEILELTKISKAFTTERDYNTLLNTILKKGKEITNCHSGTIYLIERNEDGDKKLRFQISNLMLREDESSLSFDKSSLAGYVAVTGEILNIKDAYEKPEFNKDYDKRHNYRTQSMLIIPMMNHLDEVIGVFQLINKTKTVSKSYRLDINDVIAFNDHDVELASSIAGQAAVAIESSHWLKRSKEIQELTNIGKALATERNYDKLLYLILDKVKKITGSDSGTIYLAESKENSAKRLRFKLSSLELKQDEFTVSIDKKSVAGYAALTGDTINLKDAYNIPDESEYTINLDYDRKHNYHTKSMLVVPMKNHKDEVIGVLQVINKKKHPELVLPNIEAMKKFVVSFDDNDIELVSSIAGQAAVAIENSILHQDIENLFEGFVKASVKAIESRDPATSGHSERVALYTVELAKIVNLFDKGNLKNVTFSREQIKEIRYASLLHDFGKVGVREQVLLKGEKLYPEHLELIKSRFDFIKRTIQYENSERKVQHLLEKNREEALELLAQEDQNLILELSEIDEILKTIITVNKPGILDEKINKSFLEEISARTFPNFSSQDVHYLNSHEVKTLSIGRGSLDLQERLEIESHVSHTYDFLSQIPWTNELKDTPQIAYAHHEKLDGSGYPNHLPMEKIPVQSKIMAISDIYDALVASDRPYKKAISPKSALDILQMEVEDRRIDPELVSLFIDAKIYLKSSEPK